MPNWVYNSMSVNGSKADLIAFRDKARQARPSDIKDGELVYEYGDSVLSFWNFKHPEKLEAYFADASGKKPDGYADWSMEEKLAHDLKFEGDGWYDWNVREWGCKWDAGSADLNDSTEDKAPYLHYSFETAWSIPEPVFAEIVRQHPELSFDFSCEEEQGWGAEYTSSDGDDVDEDGKVVKSLILTHEWDIPDSHSDYVERGKECWACESGDPDDLYEDCPREDTDFVVVVQRRYIVKAQTAEQAWEIAQDKLDELEPEDLDSFKVVDESSGELLFPVYEELELAE